MPEIVCVDDGEGGHHHGGNDKEDDAVACKNLGNENFGLKKYEKALECYAQGLAALSTSDCTGDEAVKLCSVLHCNASASNFHLGRYEAALKSAQRAVDLRPDWAKAWHRRGAAELKREKYRRAVETYRKAIALDRENVLLVRQLKHAKNKLKALKKTTTTAKPFGGKSRHLDLYPDRPKIPSTPSEARTAEARKILDKIKGSLGLGSSGKGDAPPIEGVFTRMMDPIQFRKILYPGIDQSQLEGLPQSLQEFLENPGLESELLSICPKAKARARTVLENVKKKGAENGEYMNEQTESMLWPGIVSEAFARELVVTLKTWNRQQHAAMSAKQESVAKTDDERAFWDQLTDRTESIAQLRNPKMQHACIDDYMGEEWCELIRKDVERFLIADADKLTSLSEDAVTPRPDSAASSLSNGRMRMCWLNDKRCEEAYPALWELAEHLYALPYELNRTMQLSLQRPFQNSILLTVFESGAFHGPRADGASGALDNGNMLTAVYHVSSNPSMLRVSTVVPETSLCADINANSDRLLLYWSRNVATELPKIPSGERRVTLSLYIKGAESLDRTLASMKTPRE